MPVTKNSIMTNDVSIVDDKDKITMDINGDQHLNMLKDTMSDRVRLNNPHIIKVLGIVIFICMLLYNVAMLDFSQVLRKDLTSTNEMQFGIPRTTYLKRNTCRPLKRYHLMNNVTATICDLHGEKRLEIRDIVSDKHRVNGIDLNLYQFEELLKINVTITKHFETNITEI